MALLSFLGIFYIFISIVLLVLFFVETKDVWFKAFYFIGFLAIIVLLIHFTYFQTNVDNDNPIFISRFSQGDFDARTPVFNGQRELSNNYDIHSYKFSEIDSKAESLFLNSNFCFYYNDSGDGSNAVEVYNGVISLSDTFYVENASLDSVCVHINSAHVRKDYLLGVRCLDCSSSNGLFLQLGGVVNASEYIINSSNTLDYSVGSSVPHAFWIETVFIPVDEVNNNFWLFMFFLFGYTAMFIMRIIYRMTKDSLDFD